MKKFVQEQIEAIKNKDLLFISAGKSDSSVEKNVINGNYLYNLLKEKDYNFKVAHRVYKGHPEISYVVVLDNKSDNYSLDLSYLQDVAFKKYRQVSILLAKHVKEDGRDLRPVRTGYLIKSNGEQRKLGELKRYEGTPHGDILHPDPKLPLFHTIIGSEIWYC